MLQAVSTLAAIFAVAAVASGSDQVCASCHPKETARWQASSMGQSVIPPAPLPPAKVLHQPSGSVITSEQRNGEMVHGLTEHGLHAEYRVKYQLGGDFMGRTYMVQTGDYLFESPISYFKRYGWDLSPGYAHMQAIDFDREMDDQCLFCHADAAQFADADGHRLKDTHLVSLSCDRCHGSSEAHLQHPVAGNIANPATMAHAERDSVCEQCHLEGATRILNPGNHWNDFRVGGLAENTFATYVLAGGVNQVVNAVNHVEQLAQSHCVRGTQGKLWCGTCHSPHGEPAANRAAQIKAVCTSCHTNLSPTAHPGPPAECTNCHMPSSATTDILHAARTDHRILRRPSEAGHAEPQRVVVWREPPAEWRDRDLGLAQVLVGYSNSLPGIADQGWKLLASIRDEKGDPAVLSDFEGRALQQGDLEQALQLGRRTVELQPNSAKAAMNLGIVLKRGGKADEAEQELKRAIALDVSLKQAYIELGTIYGAEGRMDDLKALIEDYLKFSPQDILFRFQKERLADH